VKFPAFAIVALALSVGTTYAQTPASKPDAAKSAPKTGAAGAGEAQGHTAPKPQPDTAPPATAPSGTVALCSVHIPKGVKADGKPLAAGTYQVRVTTDAPSQAAPGESPGLERWAEFLKGGKVVGREVVTIVPQAEIKNVEKDTPPKANGAKVETLKGGDYVRLWINKGGNHYLVHFPTA